MSIGMYMIKLHYYDNTIACVLYLALYIHSDIVCKAMETGNGKGKWKVIKQLCLMASRSRPDVCTYEQRVQ